MKVIVSESLGLEYAWDVISSCDQNGMQAIADNQNNEILFYDPKNKQYCTNKDLMNADFSIHDVFTDKSVRNQVMKPTSGKGFEDFATKWDALQKSDDQDVIKTKNCSMIRFGAHESRMSRSSMKGEYTAKIEWVKDFPEFGISAGDSDEVKVRFSEIDALAYAHGGNGLDELIEEKMNEKYPGIGQLDYEDDYIITNEEEMYDYHDMYIGKERVYEDSYTGYGESRYLDTFKPIDSAFLDRDDPDFQLDDYSPYDDEVCDTDEMYEVDVLWKVTYKENGIRKGDVDFYEIPRSAVSTYDELVDCIVEKIAERHGLTFDHGPDWIFVNEKFWKHELSGVDESLDDERRDWSANEDEVEVQWMIDDKELGIESGSTETVVIDLDLVDCFEELVYQVELALEKAHGGMRFDYYDEWILVDADNLLKRFGYNMNESGSNGGTIDVTLRFTNGHYGKKLKSGEEKTIKLDTSTAPTIYDQEDLMSWIADVASDQIPGGGCFTKYDFETIDPPDDVLIKAVMGDEGFGPDVDVDFEDFEPEDVPSEISYKDALKFYKKMHDAYDDRKLDYNKYDKIKKRLMNATVKGLLKEKSLDELADEWFINYGTMNGWGWKTSFKYNVACALHEIHKKKHPDEHVPDRVDTVRGWHEDNCSCGLCSSSDSSD